MTDEQDGTDETAIDELTDEAAKSSSAADEVGEAIERATDSGASAADLKALQAEKEAWLQREADLEARVTAAEEKSRRVVKAPQKKAEKVIQGVSPEPKRKRQLSRWFGDAAYGDDE